MKKSLLTGSLCLSGLLLAGTVAGVATAYAQDNSQEESKIYKMPRKSTPTRLRPYSNTAYAADRNKVSTMRGDELLDLGKDTITCFEVNPSGINFLVIDKKKKGANAEIYSVEALKRRMAKFDAKKYGQPAAAAFTPDARNVIMATDRAIYICDARKLTPLARLANSPFVPDKMAVSPNGYFLVISKGDKCAIYNLENRTLRKEINAGAKITDYMFSPDSSDFAVLTDDGVLTIYSTRTFDMRKMIDELGEGIALTYNFDGKYIAVAESPDKIEVINLLNDRDREEFNPASGPGINDVVFITDSYDNSLLTYTALNTIEANRLMHLRPYYNKLINDEVDAMMADWLKMMPGETMEEYRARVNDQTRAEKRRMFEYEISTRLAGNLIGGSAISLGAYDRANGVLAINFSDMPTIFLPVPENEVTAFRSGSDVQLEDVLYGINPDDSFEIVYAKVLNRNNGKSYIFDNLGRATMDYMNNDDAISLETLQQQQMEELRLQELREKIMNEAKSQNVISDHTNITVNSRIVPEYDADGNRILNYLVNFTYTVDPEFSVQEDFGPGKYHVEESGAATSMLKIVKQAFEGDLAQYIGKSKKLRVSLTGTADATPIVHGIAYDGSYGDFDNEPVYVDGQLSAISADSRNLIKENPQLAFLRAIGVKNYLEKNVSKYNDIAKDYRYEVNVSRDKGSEHRRITASFTFVDAF